MLSLLYSCGKIEHARISQGAILSSCYGSAHRAEPSSGEIPAKCLRMIFLCEGNHQLIWNDTLAKKGGGRGGAAHFPCQMSPLHRRDAFAQVRLRFVQLF